MLLPPIRSLVGSGAVRRGTPPHRRRLSDDSMERTQRYQVGKAVANNSDALLLLTGTPHKRKSDQFYFLISLLNPYRFGHES